MKGVMNDFNLTFIVLQFDMKETKIKSKLLNFVVYWSTFH